MPIETHDLYWQIPYQYCPKHFHVFLAATGYKSFPAPLNLENARKLTSKLLASMEVPELRQIWLRLFKYDDSRMDINHYNQETLLICLTRIALFGSFRCDDQGLPWPPIVADSNYTPVTS